MNRNYESELEQTKTVLKAAGAINVGTITMDGSTARVDEIAPDSESATYTENKWEPKLSFSAVELEAQRRAENRLKRRGISIYSDSSSL
jgi:hypothetical protein